MGHQMLDWQGFGKHLECNIIISKEPDTPDAGVPEQVSEDVGDTDGNDTKSRSSSSNQHYKDLQAHLRVSKMSDSSSLLGLNLDNIWALLPQHIQAGWGQHRQTCQTWDMRSEYQSCDLHYSHMYGVRDHIDVSGFTDNPALLDISSINLDQLLKTKRPSVKTLLFWLPRL